MAELIGTVTSIRVAVSRKMGDGDYGSYGVDAAVEVALPVGANVADAFDAWDAWLEHEPQVCFLDIRMPGMSGIDVARRIDGRTPVVFVTTRASPATNPETLKFDGPRRLESDPS